MTAGVYAIVNTVTGDRYIGSTKDFDARGKAHRAALRSGRCVINELVELALEEHGETAFVVEMIEEIAPDDGLLQAAEARWIAHFRALNPDRVYNFDFTGNRPHRAPLSTEPEPMTADELMAFREQHNLTRVQVAALVGVAPGTVRNWEQTSKGSRRMPAPADLLLRRATRADIARVKREHPAQHPAALPRRPAPPATGEARR